mgnify:CR=1 FL=1
MARVCTQVLVLGLVLATGRVSARAEIVNESIGPVAPAEVVGPGGPGVRSSEAPIAATPESKPLGRTREPRSDARKGPATETGGAAGVKPGNARVDAPFSGVAGPLIAVLGIIGILAGLATVVLRKRGGLGSQFGAGGRAPAGILEVLGRYPLSRSQTLVLLKVDRRVLLLSQARTGRLGATTLSTLCELTEPEDVASVLTKVNEAQENSLTGRFASVFRALDREAAATIERVEVPVSRADVRAPETLSRRAAPVLLPQRTEMTGAEAAASIRSRLHAIRAGGAA